MMLDFFRPHTEPARTLYDAFQAEAEKRPERTCDEWIAKERMAMWHVATSYAQRHGLHMPTLDEVTLAERLACGHVDYGAKWAIGVAEAMRKEARR